MIDVRIASLHLYPIKSCAGIMVDRMRFDALGPIDDRRWMLVDQHGEFVTLREAPRLAQVRPARLSGGLRVLAPGQPVLQVSGEGGERVDAWCWDDRCSAFDEGPACAEWFSGYLARSVRLLRFDASRPRSVRVGQAGAPGVQQGVQTRFTDGYPLLVIGRATLDAVNTLLEDTTLGLASLARFRPNLVIDGLAPFQEDRIDALVTDSGVRIRLVRPCTRCAVIEVDPVTGRAEPGLLQWLTLFRANPQLGGAVTLGQNAVIDGPSQAVLRAGEALQCIERG